MCQFVFMLVFIFIRPETQSRFYVNRNVISIFLEQHLEYIALLRALLVKIKSVILFSISDNKTQSQRQILRAIKNKYKRKKQSGRFNFF